MAVRFAVNFVQRGLSVVTKNIIIVGVGGQGSLLASKILGHLLLSEGFDVKVSEVHGMSQRGGSVITYVRFGQSSIKGKRTLSYRSRYWRRLVGCRI